MRQHPEWHESMGCTEKQHQQAPEDQVYKVKFPAAWNQRLKWKVQEDLQLTKQSVQQLLKKNSKKQLGGALFTNRSYWQSIMPNTLTAKWMKDGGVSWRLRPVPQQMGTCRTATTTAEQEHTATRMQELVQMGIYEPVLEPADKEQQRRKQVQKARKRKYQEPEYDGSTSCKRLKVISDSSTTTTTSAGTKRKRCTTNQDHESDREEVLPQVFYSPVFTILKSDGKRRRLLHDLKRSGANKHFRLKKKKQDGIPDAKGLINPGDVLAVFDFKDFFHQSRVRPDLCCTLRTVVKVTDSKTTKLVEQRMQACTLAQGMSPAPQIATDITADPLRLLRQMCGMRVLIKIDDILLICSSREELILQSWTLVKLFSTLGAIFSYDKCDLRMLHRTLWCGMVMCTITSVCSIPPAKIEKTVKAITIFRSILQSKEGVLTARAVASLRGLLISMIDGVDAARLMSLGLQELLCWMMQLQNWNWDLQVDVKAIPTKVQLAALADCESWTADYNPEDPTNVAWNGKLMYVMEIAGVLLTDSSRYQKGLYSPTDRFNNPPLRIAQPFSKAEMDTHITFQETGAAADMIVEAVVSRNYRDCTIATGIDATAAIKYIRAMGGRKKKYSQRVMQMQEVLRDRRILNLPYYQEGEHNLGDEPSRTPVGPSEFMLRPDVYSSLNHGWGPHACELFASDWNTRTANYYTLQYSDPLASGVDAMKQQLSNLPKPLWAFPPPHKKLINSFLQVVKESELEVTLIIPFWPAEMTSMALRMLQATPVILECNSKLLIPPASYRLHGVKTADWWKGKQWKAFLGLSLSGKHSNRGEFLRSWQRIPEGSTRREQTAQGVNTLIEAIPYFLSTSKRTRELACSLSQMLNSVT
jgi:hypothetical protein